LLFFLFGVIPIICLIALRKALLKKPIAVQFLAYLRHTKLIMKADAIIGVRFTTSMVMAGASEMSAYGTAVKIGE
jgi:hypothetical protein|tara:strand:+ start:33 stop:257 length:225 start_codon:yes stop_codon:yes gene_type:complete